MPAATIIKPTHKAIQTYYETMRSYAELGQTHETGVRTAFIRLLEETARSHEWVLVTEAVKRVEGRRIHPDATLYKSGVPRGYYEAKDTKDNLDVEIRKKTEKGYPLTNIIFEDTVQAVLYQGKREQFRVKLEDAEGLARLLNAYFSYTEPVLENYDQALEQFSDQVPQLAKGLVRIIEDAHKANKQFQAAFAAFFELCKTSLNPNISQAAVDEMLVQHLLTERLIRKIFDNPEFTSRNVIAVEIEKVIKALVSQSFNRDEFLRSLDSFYQAIESAAHGLEFSEKQTLLNEVYERFFQGYSVKVADTHGIVYTPQPIVDFMCASVVEVLQTEFGKTLGDEDVVILDPCTGTGNFIVNLLRRANKSDLPDLYSNRLFANEIMLLPYYIASLNIEHAYYDLTDKYAPFEGMCFVDTLDLAEGAQMKFGFMNEENSARVERQKKAPITVIIGNPPYNTGQKRENENNKNRNYDIVDQRVRDTYIKDSTAQNKVFYRDMYVKFFRWGADRLQGRDGIVCMITNNNFIHKLDGLRNHLVKDFSHIYHVDLHGDVYENPKLSGTTHNVFGIKLGVGITIAIRQQNKEHKLVYHRVPESWRKEEKLSWLGQQSGLSNINWNAIVPDDKHNWIQISDTEEFRTFLPIALDGKEGIFKFNSPGLQTNRDSWVYNFNSEDLAENVKRLIDNYNSEIDRWKRAKKPKNIDDFVTSDETKIKWCSHLKETFQRELYTDYLDVKRRIALYRPFTKQFIYWDSILNHRQGITSKAFPNIATEKENQVIWLKVGSEWPMFTLISNQIVDLLPSGGSQCFPFYTYDKDGTNRRENITDWALKQFRDHYGDESISKWDIFYYVYGILHHPGYREKFADNLKRELPRIPFAPAVVPSPPSPLSHEYVGEGEQAVKGSKGGKKDGKGAASGFWAFAEAGKALAACHLNYEQAEIYKLEWKETPGMPLRYRVEKMRLSKDKTAIKVNESLTLVGIPPEAFEYRLGNRSALDWVIDQYQVTTDKRSGITSDPNRDDDERYIVDLVGRVITVSVETVKIVKGLPETYTA